ncbi:MAG: VTT domain-containing protein [Patescibacteria group bacterium]|nr:VTT domain-containing protein [Patescibacteria group bacterium]
MENLLDPIFIIKTLGILGVFAIIFAETGLFFGFFLPGDSLLFTAGFLASQGYLSIALLVGGSALFAIVGDSVGYAFGKKTGPAIFNKENSRFFNKHHIERAKVFYEKHGRKTIILARFVPIVRTFAPIIAGVGEMEYRTFLFFNIIGGVLWTFGLSFLGYWLGNTIPNVDQYLLPIILVIIFLSLIPIIIEFLKKKV